LSVVVDGLTKIYGRFIKIPALVDVSFEVSDGDSFALLGPNASGKTTLLKVLMGLTRPNSGKASIMGFDAVKEGFKTRRHVGFVPETISIPWASLNHLLVYMGELSGLKKSEAKKKTKELLSWVGLWERRNQQAHQLSAGLRQRLLISCALIHDPEVLLLDEPTANLDPIMRGSLLNELQDLHKEGKTLLVSSHVLPEVKEICQRVGVLDRGELIYDGRLSDLTKKVTAMLEYTVRSSNDNRLMKALRDRGVEVTIEERAGLKVVGTDETTLWKNVSATANELGITVTEFKAVERSLEEALIKLIYDVRGQDLRDSTNV